MRCSIGSEVAACGVATAAAAVVCLSPLLRFAMRAPSVRRSIAACSTADFMPSSQPPELAQPLLHSALDEALDADRDRGVSGDLGRDCGVAAAGGSRTITGHVR